MNKNDKIPTARACDFFSLVVALSGVFVALAHFLFRPVTVSSSALSLLLMLGFFVTALAIRILGIIGQSLFDLSGRLESQEVNLNRNMSQNFSTLQKVAEQINCDTRDLNDNIRQIKTFFEMIEKHLNLKK